MYAHVAPPPERHPHDRAVTAYRIQPGHVGALTAQQEQALAQFVLGLHTQGELQPFPTPADPVYPCAVLRPEAVSGSLVIPAGPAELQPPLAPPPPAEAEARGGPPSLATQQRIHLLRWLRARDWHVPAAMHMYRRAHAWKYTSPDDPRAPAIEADVGVPPLGLEAKLSSGWVWKDASFVAQRGWRMYYHKTDKLGRPILIQDLAHIDTAAIFSRVTAADIVTNFAVALEAAVRYQYACASAQVGRTVDDNLMIINVAGLGLSTFWAMKGELQQLLGLLDNNFPELSGRVQIINAPWVFATMFNYIKAWLPPATRDKIDIKGADYAPTLREWIAPDCLPAFLGGECTCTDHACAWDPALTHRTAAAINADIPPRASSPHVPATPDPQLLGQLSGVSGSEGSLSAAGTSLTTPDATTPPAAPAGTLHPGQFTALALPRVPGGLCTVANAGPWPRTYAGYLHLRFGAGLTPQPQAQA